MNESAIDRAADAPVTDDFLADTADEAAFQLDHWGEAHDADKDDTFWFWTLGHIVGKAIHDPTQDQRKLRHRLRAGAALLMNWDRHVAGRGHTRVIDHSFIVQAGSLMCVCGLPDTDHVPAKRMDDLP